MDKTVLQLYLDDYNKILKVNPKESPSGSRFEQILTILLFHINWNKNLPSSIENDEGLMLSRKLILMQ